MLFLVPTVSVERILNEFGHGWSVGNGLRQGAAQGFISKLRGGQFRHGFISGLVSKISGGIMNNYNLNTTQSTAIASLAGGLASEATGGDFTEGAMRAAFVHLYNDLSLKQSLKKLWARKGEISNSTSKGFSGLRNKGFSRLYENKGKIAMAHIYAIGGGAKGLHTLMTMDASEIKGGLVGEGLFSMLTLKIASGSGSHVGYEIVPKSNIILTRGYAYTNFLTADTIYTVYMGEMYSVDTIHPFWKASLYDCETCKAQYENFW
jgi:hypothetical protein